MGRRTAYRIPSSCQSLTYSEAWGSTHRASEALPAPFRPESLDAVFHKWLLALLTLRITQAMMAVLAVRMAVVHDVVFALAYETRTGGQ